MRPFLKTTTLLLLMLCSSVYFVQAQSPLRFPYQAVARDSNGQILPNHAALIRLRITDLSINGTVLYREQHNVVTNEFGLINLTIGAGTPLLGTFASINWGSGEKYLGIEMDLSNTGSQYVAMGSSQLLSVPYAIYANSSGNAGSTTLESAYNYGGPGNGRSIHANDGALLIEGEDGLAVTGIFGQGDTITQSGSGARLLFNPRKAAFRVGVAGTTSWNNANIGDYSIGLGNNAEAPATGALAIGENANASALHSIALGNGAAASANYATAIGRNTQAKGQSSFASGFATIANGAYSMSHGVGTNAYGNASIALGNLSIVRGTNALASGESLIANGFSSAVVGRFNDTLVAEEASIQTTTPLFIVGNGSNSANRHNAMVVRNDNRVGINTSTPAATLDVNGQLKISGGTPGAGKVLTSDANGLATWETAVPGPQGPQGIQGPTGAQGPQGIQGLTGATGAQGPQGIQGLTGATGPAGSANISGTSNYLVRFSGSTSGANSQVVDNGTNVGIGTSGSPISKLHVQSSSTLSDLRLTNSTTGSSATDGLQIYTSGNQASILNKENAVLDFGTNNLTRMTLDASGNVGIGIANPGAKLDVNGQVKISGGAPGTGKVLTSDANGLASWATPAVPASPISGLPNRLAKFNSTETAGNSILTDNGTNVSIGIAASSAASNLHLNTIFSNTDFRISNNITGHTVSDGFVLAEDGLNTTLSNKENGTMSLATNDTTRFMISSSGNIGINTSSPSVLFEMQAKGHYGETHPFLIKDDQADSILHIRDDGKIGIRMTAPYNGRTLNIRGTGINYYTHASTFGGAIFPNDSSLVVWSDLNKYVVLQPQWGKVGIGTYNPSAMLDVNGDIRIGGGNPGVNKVLTSDTNGLASWQDLPTINKSLDEAYDNGGSGAGRFINADNGAVRIESDGFQVTGTLGSGAVLDLVGYGPRMFFNPRKAAFRAGGPQGNWDNSDVGFYSFGFGEGGKSSGLASGSWGQYTEASGIGSTAFGASTKATGDNSTAFGILCESKGEFATSLGYNNRASNQGSLATGMITRAQAWYSSTFGVGTVSNGYSGMVVGLYNDTSTSVQTYPTDETPLFVVGNGVNDLIRSNAMVVQQNGNVGIGASTPKSKFVLNGALGLKLNKDATIGGSVTLDNTSSVWYFTGTATITLPSASLCDNRVYTLVNRSGSARSISPYTTLTGIVNTSISANSSIEIISDGTNWLQLR